MEVFYEIWMKTFSQHPATTLNYGASIWQAKVVTV